MPAATLRMKLRQVIGGRSLNSVCVQTEVYDENGKQIEGVSNFQLANILSGRTLPWNVRVRTAQQLCELFPGQIYITDFYKDRRAPGVSRKPKVSAG